VKYKEKLKIVKVIQEKLTPFLKIKFYNTSSYSFVSITDVEMLENILYWHSEINNLILGKNLKN